MNEIKKLHELELDTRKKYKASKINYKNSPNDEMARVEYLKDWEIYNNLVITNRYFISITRGGIELILKELSDLDAGLANTEIYLKNEKSVNIL